MQFFCGELLSLCGKYSIFVAKLQRLYLCRHILYYLHYFFTLR